MSFDVIVEIEKFNPYHDSRGRFTGASSAASFTYSPGKSKAHDMAIVREKERHAAASKLNEIGGVGAKSVKAAMSEGAKWGSETQQKVATRLNQSKIRRFHDFVDEKGRECYSFRLEGYDKKGSSITSHPPKEWYSYETALAVAALGSLNRSPL